MQPDDLNTLLAMAEEARARAYAPYSHFAVGACVRTTEGQLFAGCNVENASYGLTLCAEAGALLAMVAAGQQQLTDIVIVSDAPGFCPPCGACRQRLLEFATPTMRVHLFDREGGYQGLSMVDLFPFPFDKTMLT